MSACGRSRYGIAEGKKRNSRSSKVFHQRLALRAIGMHCDIDRIVVIKAEAVVHRRLTISADRHRPTELLGKEALYFHGILDRPPGRTGVAD